MDRAKFNRLSGRAFAVAALSAVSAAIACGGTTKATHRETTVRTAKMPRPPSARGGGPISLVSAIDMIAAERCVHEGSCDRLGPGRRFRDNDACKKEFEHDTRTQLDTTVCDTGYVEPSTLLECLDAIRTSACNYEVSIECEPSKMCSP